MWVSAAGWIDDVIATPWVRSRSSRTSRRPAPTIDSELVRVSTPSFSDSFGRLPQSRILNSSFWVPNVPAASTRWVAVKVRRLRRSSLPVWAVLTSHRPSGRCLKPSPSSSDVLVPQRIPRDRGSS